MPWRAEPLYEIAKWHDSQIGNCSRVAACETQHHLMAYLHGKEVRCTGSQPVPVCRQMLQDIHSIMCPSYAHIRPVVLTLIALMFDWVTSNVWMMAWRTCRHLTCVILPAMLLVGRPTTTSYTDPCIAGHGAAAAKQRHAVRRCEGATPWLCPQLNS
jgi:hypothetical protein